MKVFSVSFTTIGIIVIIVMTAVFFLIMNRLLSTVIKKNSTRIVLSVLLSFLLTALGLTLSMYLQSRR